MTDVVATLVASGEEPTPIPPPRRKRKSQTAKRERQLLALSTAAVLEEVQSSNTGTKLSATTAAICNTDSVALGVQRGTSLDRLSPSHLKLSRLRAGSAIYSDCSGELRGRSSTVSTSCSASGVSNRSSSSNADDEISELESSAVFTEEEWMSDSIKKIMMQQTVPEDSRADVEKCESFKRSENYYHCTAGGSEQRRQSAPVVSKAIQQCTTRSLSLSPAGFDKSDTPSPSPSKSKPPPRPSSGPSRPPRPSTGPSTISKVARRPSSRIYAPVTDLSRLSKKDEGTIVIDSKFSPNLSDRPKTLARLYGKTSEETSASETAGSSNKYDASIVYGKKTQAALNKLVATVKLFNKSSSSSSSQKTTPSARKSSTHSKTPPKRPPPAVRNTPRPPIPKNVSMCGGESSDENLYVNEYDDHIYMEVGKAIYKPTAIQCYSAENSGSGGSVDGEAGREEDTYVIMNPAGNDDSHIYTPLDFSKRNECKGKMNLRS